MKVSFRTYEILALAFAGACFSGYLSAIKFFTSGCALAVPCPLFLGYPACYFGFVMFVALTLAALPAIFGKPHWKWVIGIAAVGTAFAAYFTALETSPLLALFSHFAILAIPSCIVGLAVYLAVLILALIERKRPPRG